MLCFEVLIMDADQKNFFLGQLSKQISRALFMTVEDMKTVFFEKDASNPPFDKVISFLKTTKLEDILFENESYGRYFTIKNKATGESVDFSNRNPRVGEFRSFKLRHFLKKKQKEDGSKSIYEALSDEIIHPRYADVVIGLKEPMTLSTSFGKPMLPQQFDFLVRAQAQLIQNKINKNKSRWQGITESQIDENQGLRDELLKDVLLEDIYDLSWKLRDIPGVQKFWSELQAIENKRDDLFNEGHYEISEILDDYIEKAHEKFINFLEHRDLNQFQKALNENASVVDERLLNEQDENAIYEGIANLLIKKVEINPTEIQAIRTVKNDNINLAKKHTNRFEKNHYEHQKTEFLNSLELELGTLPFTTIYSLADVMFDKDEMSFGDPLLETEIKFLKETKLSEISFEDINEAKFTIKNNINSVSCRFSNRVSNGEFRAHVLRNFLMKKQKSSPDETLYKAISEEIKKPRYSMNVAKKDLMNPKFYKPAMLGAQVDFVVRMGFQLLENKIDKNQDELKNVTPQKIRESEELRKNLWKNISLDKLYELSWQLRKIPEVAQFWKNLDELEVQRDSLFKRGFVEESNILDDYIETTLEGFFTFVQTGNTKTFEDTLRKVSNEVIKSVVNENRGGSFLQNLIKLIRDFIGLSPKSVQQVRATWKVAGSMIKEGKGLSVARENISQVKQSISEAKKTNVNGENSDDSFGLH